MIVGGMRMSNYINSLERALELMTQRINAGHVVDRNVYYGLIAELNREEGSIKLEGAARRRALMVKNKKRARK